ncbi:uncharacterized protein PG986_009836 [Apiospora aurea]|uniref:Uncharacterized protein n=1 Tax=Apiospora aurea TaxID=335848 RepID=A0ABR1Q8T9_9PEZI
MSEEEIVHGFSLGLGLPVAHFLLGLPWILSIAPRIEAHRDLRAWLDGKLEDRSLRKLCLRGCAYLFWELYWLGLIVYTICTKLAGALGKIRARKRQQKATAAVEEGRGDGGGDSNQSPSLSAPPPSYHSR